MLSNKEKIGHFFDGQIIVLEWSYSMFLDVHSPYVNHLGMVLMLSGKTGWKFVNYSMHLFLIKTDLRSLQFLEEVTPFFM